MELRVFSPARTPLHSLRSPRVRSQRSSSEHNSSIVTYERLGLSDIMVSNICLGTMTFGEQNSLKEAHQILELAWDKGINFLDTAEMYPIAPRRETQGLTSTIVGEWLKQRDRSSVVVATKVLGHSDRQQWVPASRYVPRGPEKVARVDRESIRAACEAELRRLQTDYIDLLYVHWPDRYVPAFGTHRYRLNRERSAVPFEEQVEAIGALIAEGKVRHWALSNETPYGVMSHVAAADAAGVPRPVALQQSYSLLHREAEGALAELASSPGSTSAAPARMGPGWLCSPTDTRGSCRIGRLRLRAATPRLPRRAA
uniref:Aldo keto reductase family protein n=1 Tax=Tetraselmis sp. GSL018 TaxID=582737 RepID=A0A061RJG9_9CHLO